MRTPALLVVLVIAGCGGGGSSEPTPLPRPDPPPTSVPNLYALAPAGTPVGVAVPAGDFGNSIFDSDVRRMLVDNHFSEVTAENIMKPSYLHPAEDVWHFADADELVTYAQSMGKSVHGHTLLWHRQLADWMENFSGDAAAWSDMMTTHIGTVAGHFAAADVVVSWDVVNEAFADSDNDNDGRYDLRDTIWRANIGDDYLKTAYRAARAADDDALLYYNDYNLAGVPAKLDAVLALVDEFAADPNPVPLDGIGFQMHVSLDWPSVDNARSAFALAASTGLLVKITELDITVNTDEFGNHGSMTVFTDSVAQRQEQRYRDLVSAYLDAVPPAQRGGISVWGIADIDSWRRMQSEFEWPLLFDDNFEPKPALQGFADALTGN